MKREYRQRSALKAPDIIRWLREDQEQRKVSASGPRDYCLIAKANGRACGFALMHYYPKVQLAFMAYLVVEKGVPVGSATVSHRVMARISELLKHDKHLRACKGFVFEVDDSVLATRKKIKRKAGQNTTLQHAGGGKRYGGSSFGFRL